MCLWGRQGTLGGGWDAVCAPYLHFMVNFGWGGALLWPCRAPARAVTGNLEEVVALATMHHASDARLLLAAAHASGEIHVYDADSGAWLSHFRAQPNINGLVAAERCASRLAVMPLACVPLTPCVGTLPLA